MTKLYEFIKILDRPSLTSEYVGEIFAKKNITHSKKEHKFNLQNKEQRDVLLDIIKKYGLTGEEFTEKEKEEHHFFYKILQNNFRKNTGLVYYYYNKELEYLDSFNDSGDKELYKNGILLYNKDDILSVDRVYRLTEKENYKDETRGYTHESIEEFKAFFLSKRSGHNFKKDLDDILNAEDNANEYKTTSKGTFFSTENQKSVENNIYHTAKAPKMDFILSRSNLNEKSKLKFKKYLDLKDFVEKFNKDEFNKEELKKFFNAIDEIDKEYLLHFELMDKVEEIKEKLGL